VTYFALIRSPGVGRTITLFFVVPTAILAYGADVSDRLGLINLSNKGQLILGWGRHDDTFFESINSGLLTKRLIPLHPGTQNVVAAGSGLG
jgi:hypothetical protein